MNLSFWLESILTQADSSLLKIANLNSNQGILRHSMSPLSLQNVSHITIGVKLRRSRRKLPISVLVPMKGGTIVLPLPSHLVLLPQDRARGTQVPTGLSILFYGGDLQQMGRLPPYHRLPPPPLRLPQRSIHSAKSEKNYDSV